MIKNFVKILELLGDRLEVCVSVYIYLCAHTQSSDKDEGSDKLCPQTSCFTLSCACMHFLTM